LTLQVRLALLESIATVSKVELTAKSEKIIVRLIDIMAKISKDDNENETVQAAAIRHMATLQSALNSTEEEEVECGYCHVHSLVFPCACLSKLSDTDIRIEPQYVESKAKDGEERKFAHLARVLEVPGHTYGQ